VPEVQRKSSFSKPLPHFFIFQNGRIKSAFKQFQHSKSIYIQNRIISRLLAIFQLCNSTKRIQMCTKIRKQIFFHSISLPHRDFNMADNLVWSDHLSSCTKMGNKSNGCYWYPNLGIFGHIRNIFHSGHQIDQFKFPTSFSLFSNSV